VQIRGLTFRRGARVIFDNVDLDIERGKITAIMGPSGTGKTTLLRLIGGQLRPDAGSIKVFGQEVGKLSRRELFELRKRIGMLFQSGALLTDLTVFDNVAFPLREHTDLTEPMIRDIVLMKLQVIGLRGSRDLYPDQLSGGMMRRVALARAIVMDPDLGRFPVVWAAAGTATAVFPTPPATLRMLSNAHVAPITEGRREADARADALTGSQTATSNAGA